MARPRTWDELRRRVLEEDLYDVAELERRRDKARQMKYGLLAVPALVLLVPQIVFDGASWPMVLAMALIAYGGISSYVMGRIFERRWDQLIREKSALNR